MEMSVQKIISDNAAKHSNTDEKSLSEKAAELLLSLGFAQESQGFAYIRDAAVGSLCANKL